MYNQLKIFISMKTKNKFIVKGLLILLLIGFAGCDDNFLATSPTQDVSDETVTSSPTNMMLGLNGIHRSLYIRYMGCQGCVGLGALMTMNDVMGDDYVMTLPSSQWHYGLYQWQDHRNSQGRENTFPWLFYYQIIRNANVIISGEETVEGPQAEIDIPVGQSLIYRAFSHFQLVQLYAERYDGGAGNNSQPGIPIVLTAENEGLARSSVEEVYAQVHQDLDEAIQKLSSYNRPNKSHLDVSVATGLKARIYLVQQDWANAAQYAEEARVDYLLMSNDEYVSGFNDFNNPEWMWGSHVTDDQGDRWGNFGSYNSRNNSTTNIRSNPKAINSALYERISETDIRAQNFDPTGEHTELNLPPEFSRAPYTSQKFIAVTDRSMDVPYMRAAEMYLIEAEAKAHMGDSDAVNVLYELISNRDPGYVMSSNSGQALLEEIWFHRRVELWGEGFRFNDLKRLNQPLDRTGANHIASAAANLFEVPAGDDRWQYLIPRDEIDSNPNMDQNP